MGWRQFVPHAQKVARRSERFALQRYRELLRAEARGAMSSPVQRAAGLVNRYESYLALLVTVHADCGGGWDWGATAASPRPPEPELPDRAEPFARAALEGYQPGFWERLHGGTHQRRAALEQAVREAAALDRQAAGAVLERHRRELAVWTANVLLAQRVLAFDLEACRDALALVCAFDELRAFGSEVSLALIAASGAMLTCRIADPAIVPEEELRLTATGQLFRHDMPADRYWRLLEEHVCSCAIRVARETFVALPVPAVVVNVELVRRKASAGHSGVAEVLSVRFSREELDALDPSSIEPTAVIARFVHLDRGSGLRSVAPVSEVGMVTDPPSSAASREDLLEADEAATYEEDRDPSGEPADSLEVMGDELLDERAVHSSDRVASFVAWVTKHMEARVSAGFKIKTLVNQLGRHRADQRLSLKAVLDLTSVLADAGFELDPDPRAATRSPGIDARVRLVRSSTEEETRAAARRATLGAVALWRFLWGAGVPRLYLSATIGRPQRDDVFVESVPDLLRAARADPAGTRAALEPLLSTGALAHWLREAQQDAQLGQLAFDLHRDPEPQKSQRWLRAARAKPRDK